MPWPRWAQRPRPNISSAPSAWCARSSSASMVIGPAAPRHGARCRTPCPKPLPAASSKFLFLPDGEDPDTLVGKEGKAAFEARYATALPLSEYFVTHLRRGHRHLACRRQGALRGRGAPAARTRADGPLSRAAAGSPGLGHRRVRPSAS